MEVVELTHNNLTTIPRQMIKCLGKLRVLNLDYNNLSDNSRIPHVGKLDEVHINYNPGLTRVPRGFSNVKHVYKIHMTDTL